MSVEKQQKPSQELEPQQEPSQAQEIIIQDSQEPSKSELVFKQQSIIPSIKETERFIQFLNKRFNLNVQDDLVVLIEQTSPSTKGFFKYSGCSQIWKDEPKQEDLKSITISSHILQEKPYETIAHELAHYLDLLINKKLPKGNYHTLKFKAQAERLFLSVVKMGYYGYAHTSPTDEFNQMLQEFKPGTNAFKIFQEPSKKKAKPSRLLLFICGCGCKIRTAKNEHKPLKANCLYCNTEFKEVTQ